MARPQIAVFGAGLIGARHVAEAARQARLAAIVDPAPGTAALANDHGVPHFATPEACLDAMRPDGVVIATPNQLHEAQALLCIAEGLPVLIEKPIADTLASADRILAAAQAADVPVLVGHHRRHNPIIKRAKAEIDAGTLGDIVVMDGQFWLYKPDAYFDATWRTEPGGGPLMINLIHDIDLMRHLCGDITRVVAMRSNARRGHAVEDSAALLIQFRNGALGTVTVTDTAVAPWSWEMSSAENPIYPHTGGNCYRIGGTHGAMSLPDLQLWSHDATRSWWEPISARTLGAPHGDAFALQFAHFLDVIEGATPLVTARDGRESLAAVLQTVAADLEGSP